MNKYQIRALLDLGKVTIAVIAVIAAVNVIIMMGATVTDVLSGISFTVAIYCLYQLFKIRVSQLESQDKESK